ncbi:hypothetical protein A2U01_0101002, partial [Trifolium medium]|nr:hypothetical protein [Trifolium medium]
MQAEATNLQYIVNIVSIFNVAQITLLYGAHEILGVASVSVFWNWGMEAMTKLVPS